MSIQLILLFSLVATTSIATSHHHHHKPTHETIVLPEKLHFLWSWIEQRSLFMNKSLIRENEMDSCKIFVSSFSQLACRGVRCRKNRRIMHNICYLGVEMSRIEMLQNCC
ncbi:hypothetical protein CAEBREN_01942 [Caenorhabditis brenneri]|uniref:Uncharacterized protein n=1 Tax=Caenorhabditis brenneri TaxID=135651 RepID=G0MJB6_CAEBE|nr:hypothetical protein CAEBREN_01942 [Caenorhabditis brenneri]